MIFRDGVSDAKNNYTIIPFIIIEIKPYFQRYNAPYAVPGFSPPFRKGGEGGGVKMTEPLEETRKIKKAHGSGEAE